MPDSGRRGSAFVIATRNRPDSLLATVKSLVAQTELPAELCVVDSSEEAPRRAEIEALCADAGVDVDYHHPAPAGLCRQRNIGVDRTSGDPVVFIDDDVELQPDCHERLVAHYARDERVGAVCGSDLVPDSYPSLYVFWRRAFGLSTWTTKGTGKMKPSFYVDAISRAAESREVEYMNGWLMSCRREVLQEERFDDAMPGYGQKEDIDFGYRVSRKWKVIKASDATGVHHQIATSRLNAYDLAKMSVENQFYLHRKNMPQSIRHRAALWWAMLGFLLLNAGKAIRHRDPGYVTGIVAGLSNELRRRRTGR